MVTLIKKHSLVKDSTDWEAFGTQIEADIDALPTIDSANTVLSKIIKELRKYGDHHSFYYSKERSKENKANTQSVLMPESKLIGNSIGYLSLPSHFSQNSKLERLYADTLKQQIERLDQNHEITGWIVDLRENSGGNMWPMIAGLNPLVKDGTVGYFVTSKKELKWTTHAKKPYYLKRTASAYKCKNVNHKIAVLIDSLTASSGEMTAISLFGMEHSKSFGNESAGYTTANAGYTLSNGDNFYLASSFCMDRNKKMYKGKIQPDVQADDSEAIDKAVEWIEN